MSVGRQYLCDVLDLVLIEGLGHVFFLGLSEGNLS